MHWQAPARTAAKESPVAIRRFAACSSVDVALNNYYLLHGRLPASYSEITSKLSKSGEHRLPLQTDEVVWRLLPEPYGTERGLTMVVGMRANGRLVESESFPFPCPPHSATLNVQRFMALGDHATVDEALVRTNRNLADALAEDVFEEHQSGRTVNSVWKLDLDDRVAVGGMSVASNHLKSISLREALMKAGCTFRWLKPGPTGPSFVIQVGGEAFRYSFSNNQATVVALPPVKPVRI